MMKTKKDLKFQGWCECLDSVRASLRAFPNGGGDIEIMQEVERIQAEAYQRGLDAAKDHEDLWRLY